MKQFGLIVFLSLFSMVGHGALYQCKNAAGEVEFMDMPCPEQSKQTTLARDLDERGFFKKYFQKPRTNKLKAKCTSEFCFCGQRKTRMYRDAERQLIDSAEEIPRLWQNFHNAYSRYKRSKDSYYGGDFHSLQEIACELALHQSLFNKHFEAYQHRASKTQASKNKIKGSAIECGESPVIKSGESQRQFRHRFEFYGACLKKKNRNYSYRNSMDSYKGSQKVLRKMETAFDRLRQKP